MSPPPFTAFENRILEGLMAARMSGEHHRVALAIAREVFGWHQPSGKVVAKKQIARMTGMDPSNVRRVIADLHSWGVIQIGNPRDKNGRLLNRGAFPMRFNPNPLEWVVLTGGAQTPRQHDTTGGELAPRTGGELTSRSGGPQTPPSKKRKKLKENGTGGSFQESDDQPETRGGGLTRVSDALPEALRDVGAS